MGKADPAFLEHRAIDQGARTAAAAAGALPAFFAEQALAIGTLQTLTDSVLQLHQIGFDGFDVECKVCHRDSLVMRGSVDR